MPRGASSRIALGRDVVPHDLAIDVLLADAAGDELGVLRAEIEDQHFFVGHKAGRAGRIDGGGALHGDCFPPDSLRPRSMPACN